MRAGSALIMSKSWTDWVRLLVWFVPLFEGILVRSEVRSFHSLCIFKMLGPVVIWNQCVLIWQLVIAVILGALKQILFAFTLSIARSPCTLISLTSDQVVHSSQMINSSPFAHFIRILPIVRAILWSDVGYLRPTPLSHFLSYLELKRSSHSCLPSPMSEISDSEVVRW